MALTKNPPNAMMVGYPESSMQLPPSLLHDPSIRAWYSSNIDHSAYTPATLAYASALSSIRNTLSPSEATFLSGTTSLTDVLSAVNAAKTAYQERKTHSLGKFGDFRTKTNEYLVAFSQRVSYYGAIMDVFVQHHPEYVSLAWGTMKFLFVGVLNHTDLIHSIAKTLVRIADVLPRTQLSLDLYPTPAMLSAVSEVYAHMIKFMGYAISWYKKGKIAHGFAAILKPFQIAGKEAADNIAESSRRVDELANAANKAESRDMHLKIIELTRMGIESRALFTKLSVDIKVIMSNQVPRIESLPIFLSLPQPLDTLQFNQAMRNRYRLRQRDPHLYDHLIPLLSDWASRPSENLLLAQPKADPKSARFFATDVVEAVRGTGIPILFALPARSVSGSKTTFVDVLRSLTLQALKMEHDSPASSFDQPISSREVENARDEGEWISLLNRAMADLERVFMVIDMDIIKDDVRLPQQKAIGIIEKLLELCGSTTKVKVILTARRFEQPGRGGRNAGSDEEDDDYDRKRRNQPARSYCFTDKKQRGPPRSPRYTKIGQKSPSYKPKQMAMTLRPAFASPRARATNRTISRKETVDSESE